MNITCNLCTHPAADHSDLAGCLFSEGTTYCDCRETQAQIAMQTARNEPLSAQRAAGRAEGRRRRDVGAEAAGSAAPGALVTAWRVDAAKAMNDLIASGVVFSADDLVDRVGMPPVANMVGAQFVGASTAKRIVAVGYVAASRPESHGRIQRTWQAAPQ
jgi:hypothetical protein